jgi:hypothetical protein
MVEISLRNSGRRRNNLAGNASCAQCCEWSVFAVRGHDKELTEIWLNAAIALHNNAFLPSALARMGN